MMKLVMQLICVVTFLIPGAVVAGVVLPPCGVPACHDLTEPGDTTTINGAIYTVPETEVKATGTGAIDPFVRLQRTGTEQGYNTSDRPVQFDENTDAQFTHDLLLSSLNTVTVGGIEYVEFVLDLNENNSPAGRYISLEQLRIYSGENQTNSYDETLNTLGTLSAVYDMDAAPGGDTYIQLDYSLWSGQGQLDLILLVPASLFTLAPGDPGDGSQTYVYLYSQFGQDAPLDTDAGFEEWAHKVSGTFTPEPGALALILIGLAALGYTMRRRPPQSLAA